MMKIFILALSFQFLIFLFPIAVHAHILSKNESIGAVMHIDPDDDPVGGRESTFYFQIKDTSNNFSFSDCECILQVVQNGKEIASQPLLSGGEDGLTLKAAYTFTKRDLYVINVIGRPTSKNAFDPFRLSYSIRVDRLSASDDRSRTNTQLVLSGVIILIIGIILSVCIKTVTQWLQSFKRP